MQQPNALRSSSRGAHMDIGNVTGLIDRARRGDEAALGAIIEQLRPQLIRRAKYELDSKVYARFDPSDVVQVTCLELHRDFHAFQGASEGELIAWVKRILQHNVANTIRRHVLTAKRSTKSERSIDESLGGGRALLDLLCSPASSPSARMIRSEVNSEIEEAVEQLPADQKEAVRLRHLEGYSLRQLAEHFDRSEVAAAGLLKRGMKNLRRILPPQDAKHD